MTDMTLDVADFHWVTQILDTMDSGLIVLDNNYHVCVWNSFMQSYSGVLAQHVLGKSLFECFKDLPKTWLQTKLKTSVELETRSFSSWENRPYLFKFINFSPVSHGSNFMYQDIVITPLRSLSGKVSHTAIQINDVSEIAWTRIHLREKNHHLSEISRKDGLTGLYNRTYWEDALNREFKQLQLLNKPSSLVILDIDFFKKVNDTYGHSIGDDVIRHTAKQMKMTARSGDTCGRFGGEEFTVLLPETTAEQAHHFAERLRHKIKKSMINVGDVQFAYTVSLGVCEFNPQCHSTYLEWLNHADAALYQAKKSGRDQVCIYQSHSVDE